jgi:hypothetical protein
MRTEQMKKPIKDAVPEMIGAPQTERYTSARKIEFLLNNAVDAADYARALNEAEQIALRDETGDEFNQ